MTQNGVTAPARFLFNEVVPSAGAPLAEITGWSNASTPIPTVTATTNATKVGAVQTGLALVPGRPDKHGKSEKSGKNGPRLLAADAVNGVIDVYDGNFNPLVMPGAFVDPHSVSEGLAPQHKGPRAEPSVSSPLQVASSGDWSRVLRLTVPGAWRSPRSTGVTSAVPFWSATSTAA